ncbi:ubiquinol-cytochrome c reductase iron-sulfur subunit [Colwellia sp. 4_MG-2023]|jgi:ubiquinol-cytochrome c reductase iron-sulfur subunit|uniref:ubiquinol-cytochrome c reductase iron-sulfur subunit n=1 Tax=unclassified Colwellia TaxID=196834 RepID=UPI001C0823E3|nr:MULTISPECIES: ubiquinol-cytochrome c reductase iron-sulfur subunit [unclassified Colwellia]MBU2926226.1 ubiquinol-cytochrome c reductase iron-sulfur subunit [Colwellia sp. C2M11]MDO6508472.1 ubiquinol-cytochrome c reductase iron-sulfur subunit [Colwellia sp. 5_MG-2023]MDO6557087.1 ubiquinol-cytochrome c reductase iron-sulfur subunit [Colwellia sp. 4_MG-2023]MDO6652352.1 ubiquinol-cytochrome c reductase iron-sulfur subunit [Colwellia sp. 3_MG-2023]MDO6666888.1 ubiquinol-cytochrome c reductas
MSNVPVNNGRRRFLTAATAVVGGAGVVGVAVPFIGSWNPSARAKAAGAPVEVNVGKIEPGQLIRAEWRGKPVYVVRRTEETVNSLAKHDDKLRDPNSEEAQQPDYATNAYRSIKPEFLVALGVCTHLGCAPTYHGGDYEQFVDGVKDGFFCPCHGSKFDMAGRVFQGVPAPLNLMVPEHSFTNDNTLLIGVSEGEA